MKRLILFAALLTSIIVFANGETISPNMSLVIPAVGITTGPQWSADLNMSLGIIDNHDHSPGKGVQITPAGININDDLSCNDNSITNVSNVQFFVQSAAPGNGSVYENGVDLYYVDGNGNNIRLTQAGSIVGTSGSISGLTPPASASYSSGSSTFVWQSASNTAANLDAACLLQRDLTSGSNAITLCPPSALSSNYSLTWPASLPPAQQFATIDQSGNISAPWSVDNSTLTITSNIVQVKAQGITQGLLAPRATGSTVVAGGIAVSASSGGLTTYTSTGYTQIPNLSITITTTGRPIFVAVQGDGTSAWTPTNDTLGSFISLSPAVGSILIQNVTQGTAVTQVLAGHSGASQSAVFGSLFGIDLQPAGTYTYNAYVGINSGNIAYSQSMVLVAYEL